MESISSELKEDEVNPFREGAFEKKVVHDDYFLENCELIIVDGGSTDRTCEVVREYIDGPKSQELGINGKVRLLNNPGRVQSQGLNAGIKEAKGEIICRADAHCIFPLGYVKRCVELLEATGAANVGGMMVPVANGPYRDLEPGHTYQSGVSGGCFRRLGQVIISRALRHPLGAGDAKWRLGRYAGFVDTVYLGTFRREIFDEVGLYDANLKTNEDAELNLRILKAGKRIYLDSSIQVQYFPRETLKKLAKQYFNYGQGRCYTTLKHKKFTSLRQVAPLAVVAGLLVSIMGAVFERWLLIFPLIYAVGLTGIAFLSRERGNIKSEGRCSSISFLVKLGMAAAWAIIHVSWGLGFWKYLILRK